MGKVTIVCVAASTVILLVTFGQGMGVLHGGDVSSHLRWALATLVSVLAANFIAMTHAAQSDRIIRSLRERVAALEAKGQ
jgi:integral membrane sensor domain MASE1